MQDLSKTKSEWVDMLHLQSVTRGIAAYRLQHEALDSETRSNLEEELERTDYRIVRVMAGLTVLMADDCPLRRLFIEDPDARVVLIEEIVANAQKLAQQGVLPGAIVAQVARLAESAYKN
jgi:hypothetical protein